MPTNLKSLDNMSKAKRYDYLKWEMLAQNSSEGVAYFAMQEFRSKPTKKKFICILEEFIDANSPRLPINIEQGAMEKGVDTQVINELNQLLNLARTQRALSKAMRGEGVMGKIRAATSTDLRPPPPPACFDPILVYQCSSSGTLTQIVARHVSGAAYTPSPSMKVIVRAVVANLKDAGFSFVENLTIPA